MSRYSICGENIEVTEAIRDYVEKKVGKLEKYPSDSFEVAVHTNLKTYTEKVAKVEATIPLPYLVLQAEEMSPDSYASVDSAANRLEWQIRRFKIKTNRKSHKIGCNNTKAAIFLVGEETEEIPSELDIVHTKRLLLKPMGNEEAVLQMNMLRHNLFILEDAKINGTSIVHCRKNDKYGLIETS